MTVEFTKKGRAYRLDGEPVTSVTTAIGTLDKSGALTAWAARESASYAVDNWDDLTRTPIADRLERITKARFNKNRAATTKGHRIHSLAEAVAHGKTVDVPDDLSRASVEAYARLLDQWEMETVATELPVAHPGYLYAGTADLVAYAPRLGTLLLDTKTGRKVYPEVALQLAAYRYAEIALEQVTEFGPRGGKKTVHRQIPMPHIDRCAVIHVHEDSVELVPVVVDEDVWSIFLHLLEVHDLWVKRTGYDFRNDDGFDPPVRESIWPEITDEQIAELPS